MVGFVVGPDHKDLGDGDPLKYFMQWSVVISFTIQEEHRVIFLFL